MKRVILALTLPAMLALCSTAALAQDQQSGQEQRQGGHGHFDPQKRVDMLAKRLNLSDDQKQKLLPIFTDEQQQMQSIRQDSSLSREDRMQKVQTLRQQTNDKVNGILNDDQKQKYAQIQQEMRERMQQRMKEHGGSNNQ